MNEKKLYRDIYAPGRLKPGVLHGFTRGVFVWARGEEEALRLDRFYEFLNKGYGEAMRDNGKERVITHLEACANRLVAMGVLDTDLLLAAYGHDWEEDKGHSMDELLEMTNTAVAGLINAVSKVISSGLIQGSEGEKSWIDQELTIQKLVAANVVDPRAALLKDADVTHNSADLWGGPKNPQSKAKAILALRIFEPHARAYGAIPLAKEMGDNAIRVLQPAKARAIEIFRDQTITPVQFNEIVALVNSWGLMRYDALKIDESPPVCPAISVRVPTIYEIHRKSGKELTVEDVLPDVSCTFSGEIELLSAYGDLVHLFGLLPEEENVNPYTFLLRREPIIKRVPVVIGDRQYRLPVKLQTRLMSVKPIDLVRDPGQLTELEVVYAKEQLAAIVQSYKQAIEAQSNLGDVSQDIETALARGMVPFWGKNMAESHTVPNGATALDGLHAIGQNLANDSVSVTIIRRGQRLKNGSFTTILEPGDQIIGHPVFGNIVLPSRYNDVITPKALRDIKARMDTLLENPEVLEDARRRGVDILLWLYRNATEGSELDIHLDSVWKRALQEKYNTLDSFKEKLGFIPLPAKDPFMPRWREFATASEVVQDAFDHIKELVTERQSLWSLQISMSDQQGILGVFGGLAGRLKGNILPMHVDPDHFGRGKRPIVMRVVFTEGDENSIRLIAAEFDAKYRGLGVEVQIIPPTKDIKPKNGGSGRIYP